MESVLQDFQWKTCLLYLDNLVTFARTEGEIIKRIDEVFTALQTAKLKLKPRKCILLAWQNDYLGHVIFERGMSVSPSKISAIRERSIPEIATSVRSFLSTLKMYLRYITWYLLIIVPST